MWQNPCSFKDNQTGGSLIRPVKAVGIDKQLHLPTDEMPDAISMLHVNSERMLSFDGSTPRVLNQGTLLFSYIKECWTYSGNVKKKVLRCDMVVLFTL